MSDLFSARGWPFWWNVSLGIAAYVACVATGAPPAIAQVVAAVAMIALGIPGTYLISAILTRLFGRDFS